MQDPNFKQEQKKYENPIPSRDFILSFIKEKKYTHIQLSELLELTPEQIKPLRNRLRAMVRDKQLSCNAKGLYRIFSNRGLLIGEIIANSKGFGFIKLDKGGKDLRLNSRQMQLVFHGDMVKARLLNNRLDAEVVHIISKHRTFVCRLQINGKNAVAIVDDKKILNQIQVKKLNKNHKNNSIVIVQINKNATIDNLAIGEIISVLGDYLDEGLEIKSAIIRNQIPDQFSKDGLQQANKLPDKVAAKDKKDRKDLTKLAFVTIDGEDSRDFDDAVFAKPYKNGWKLFVAIADVAYYIKEGSALDEEALDRGNSVYFPRQVIPMLPDKISNGLCSLNPKVDRLTITCEMVIDENGKLLNYKFYNSMIFSNARLTYTQVADFLENGSNSSVDNLKIATNLTTLYELYKVLKIAKEKRGVMDFDRAESKIIFNNDGKIDDIVASSRNDAHKLIEECMLMANQSAALFLAKNDENFLYRIHPNPTDEKIAVTKKFLATIGISLSGGDNPSSDDFSKTLKDARGRVDENIIKTVILRTMKQANYSPNNSGHFGLAFEDYAHFTSPIRRYADLLVHRAIKRAILKKSNCKRDMVTIGKHISMTERRADDATRDVEKWLKCEYMASKVGQGFSGIIASVTSFGLFVELDNIFVEGLILLRDLKNDYYLYDESKMSLIGSKSGKGYKLGDKVNVILVSVSLDERRISLVIDD